MAAAVAVRPGPGPPASLPASRCRHGVPRSAWIMQVRPRTSRG